MKKLIKGKYFSSNGYQTTSTESQEILPPEPLHWNTQYVFRKFSFISDQDCTVIINGEFTIPLIAGLGFEVDRDDVPIESFVILESNTRYYWIGAI